MLSGVEGSVMPYYVYILTNNSGTLYIGITNNLERRVIEHELGNGSIFTSRYRVSKLVYYEETNDPYEAISREKQLKGWRRSKKLTLISSINPEYRDYFTDASTALSMTINSIV